MNNLSGFLDAALGLGLEAKDLGVSQMSLRALIVFVIAVSIVRMGDGRFMGRSSAMDVMLAIVFGSVVSRGITGTAPFFPTLAASVTLVAVHWLISAIAFRSSKFGWLFKGRNYFLADRGTINWNEMRKSHISENDLKEAIRQHGHPDDVSKVESAYLERDGSISIVLKEKAREERKGSNRPPQSD